MINNQKYWSLINFICWSNNFDWKLTKIIVDNFIVDNLTDCWSRKVDKKSFYHWLQIDNRLKKLNTATLKPFLLNDLYK
jgi:hypothetical protein